MTDIATAVSENARYNKLVLAEPASDPNYGLGSPLNGVLDNLEARLAAPDIFQDDIADLQRRIVTVGVAAIERADRWRGEGRAVPQVMTRVLPHVPAYVGNTLLPRLRSGPSATGLADVRFVFSELRSPDSSQRLYANGRPSFLPRDEASGLAERIRTAAGQYAEKWLGLQIQQIDPRRLGPIMGAAAFMAAGFPNRDNWSRESGLPVPLFGILRRERAAAFLGLVPESKTRGLPAPVRTQTTTALSLLGRYS